MVLRRKLNNLRKIRKEKGLSGYDLQLLTYIPAREIYHIERGLKTPTPYEKTLISEGLNMPKGDIFPDDMQGNKEILEDKS